MPRIRRFFGSLSIGLSRQTKALWELRRPLAGCMILPMIMFSIWLIGNISGLTNASSSTAVSSCACGCQDSCTGTTVDVEMQGGKPGRNKPHGWAHVKERHIDGASTSVGKGSLFPKGTKKSDLEGLFSSMACSHFQHATDKPRYERHIFLKGVCGKIRLVTMPHGSDATKKWVKTMYPTSTCACVCNQSPARPSSSSSSSSSSSVTSMYRNGWMAYWADTDSWRRVRWASR